ncbi:fatty acid desaturase family protein [Gemmata sp. JC673]|uniref:Fatty acid desaturase family protein n=1 Tax=Gemmata algarum TaxID=2975278 RepID=A0ABU5F6D9_9BACT|nr:fatty acid desaturase CarF family protein [Gemmata algarum]MDY3563148.1 fatty acid desaturase family protein [Gemmata algarum]
MIVSLVRFVAAPGFWDWPTLVLIPLGLLGADFVSGFVHWAGDTWGTPKTPLVGWRFVRPFRFHHAYPLDMVKSNFFTTNGDNVLGASPFLIAPLFFPTEPIGWLYAGVFVWAIGAFAMWTSQFHLWAHMKNPPRFARVLQSCRLILTKDHHQKHHKLPYQANYCITTGWCNPFLTAIRFFPAMEWVVSRATGMTPRPDEGGNDPEFYEKIKAAAAAKEAEAAGTSKTQDAAH